MKQLVVKFLSWAFDEKENHKRDLRKLARVEWRMDQDYAYEMLVQGIRPNTH